ncbi:unnamed protein product, partial [Ilex paraguariensis]
MVQTKIAPSLPEVQAAATFLIDQNYLVHSSDGLSLDDDRGLQRSAEPLDKGYVSNTEASTECTD